MITTDVLTPGTDWKQSGVPIGSVETLLVC